MFKIKNLENLIKKKKMNSADNEKSKEKTSAKNKLNSLFKNFFQSKVSKEKK